MLLTCAVAARAEFQTIDIFVDSKGEALAAYQLEFSANQKAMRVVGVEGGDHEAFKKPPFYDPKAIQRNRVIIGTYSTAKELPIGKTRVATIHVQVSGTGAMDYRVKLQTAANSEGDSIAASATWRERDKE
jgi:hypothetical protein